MIYVIGVGPGDTGYLTAKGEAIIQKADIVIGAKRNLESIDKVTGIKMEMGSKLSELTEYLEVNLDKEIAVLASGDPLIYGIGKYLSEQFADSQLTIIPGISAVQYMFSRIPLDMNEVYITSSHGKKPDFNQILSYAKVAMVTDHLIGPAEIAQEISIRGLSKVLWIGENLTYPDENISKTLPKDVKKGTKFKRNVVVILDEK